MPRSTDYDNHKTTDTLGEDQMQADDQQEALNDMHIEEIKKYGECDLPVKVYNGESAEKVGMVEVFGELLTIENMKHWDRKLVAGYLHQIYKTSPALKSLIDKYIERVVEHY